MSGDFNELIAEMGQGSRRRAIPKGRKRIRITVRRTTIEFTAQMAQIIDTYSDRKRKKFVWEVVYDALACLAEKEGIELTSESQL